MDLTFDTIYKNLDKVFNNHKINLKDVTFCDSWAVGMVCLKAIENMGEADKELIVPDSESILSYSKRMHFDVFMEGLTYKEFLEDYKKVVFTERENLNIHEIMHCSFRDELAGRLSSKIRLMFRDFGMNKEEEQRVTALVGELGNNVFDHNEGEWPTSFRGAIIIAQRYPQLRKIEVVVADAGVGFLGSLKTYDPAPKDDVEAIKLGLLGITGRAGERRGNGLKTIQDWTINNFNGIVRIHSGNGLVVIDKGGQKIEVVNKILGTLAEIVISYK
jgi:hypothetical protein